MKNPAAFISYARRDDTAYGGRITGLRQRLQRMVASAIGRDFEIFQDCEGVAWAQHWRTRLDEALEEALFLIPILTPSYFNSEACRTELETFLELERRSGLNDRILSLYFLDTPTYERRTDPLAAILQERQHRDWRHLRIDPLGSAKIMRALDSLARELADAIHARQGKASPPALEPHPEAQTAALASSRKAFGTPTVLQKPRLEPGTIFREINEPWCPELVVIPPGEFMMGSPEGEEGANEGEGPQHLVTIGYPLAVGRYPLTFDEYDHFAQAAGREQPGDEGWGRGRRPVINVSWDDAKAYARWLSSETSQLYRLLSEAEWEYACRAGSTARYSWGDEISPDNANYGEEVGKTSEVGAYAANPWGLHDMHGNAWEWVEDCWNGSYTGAPDDGSVWTSGDCRHRVIRGGRWGNYPEHLRSAARRRGRSNGRSSLWGFRVARTLGP